MARALLLVGLVLITVSAIAAEFAAYPSARRLCQEHVMANRIEISWQSFASTDAPATVIAHYTKQLGRAGVRDNDGKGDGIEWRAGKDGDSILTVFAVDKAANYPHCATAPTPAEKSVILISTATRF